MSAFGYEVLPPSFQNEIQMSSSTVIIRSNVKNLEDCNKWVKEFGERTNTKWNSRTSRPCAERFVCSKLFVCHHSAFMKVPEEENRRSFSKNSNCQAKINIKVKLNTRLTRKSDAFVRRGLVAVIRINAVHSHSLNTAEALKFLPALDSKEEFLEYFADGMGVAEACRYHESILRLRGDFAEEDLADRRINPPSRVVSYWHQRWRQHDTHPEMDVFEKLREKSKIYEERGNVVWFGEEPFALAIVTPTMRRAHRLQSSGEIVFVHSTPSRDPDSYCITFMMCPCAAGAVPLALIITKGQSEDAYKKGFRLLVEAVEKPFHGDGCPATFMTTDSEALIEALKSVWPSSRNLLCVFQVAQAAWRWLWDSKREIPKEHKTVLMSNFQRILYARTIQEAEEEYKNSCGADQPTYKSWNKYLQNCWKRKELWCLAFRNEDVRGHSTNNFSEVCMRIFKDQVLGRLKACNVITILDLVATHLEAHYVQEWSDFANSQCASSRQFLLSLKKTAATVAKEDIEMHSTETFSVKSDSNCYEVNMKTGCCSCSEGVSGRFCKHQYSILKYYNVTSCHFPPFLPDDKHEISVLALGEKTPPQEFFEPLVFETAGAPKRRQAVPTEPISISHQEEDGTASDEEEKEALFKDICRLIYEKNKLYKPSLGALKAFLRRIKSINSQESWETFLRTAGSSEPLEASSDEEQTSTRMTTRGGKRLLGETADSAPPSKKGNAPLNQQPILLLQVKKETDP